MGTGLAQVVRSVPLSEEHPGGAVGLKEVQGVESRAGVDYWRRIRGARAFPSRADLVPREISGILRNLALLRLVDGGQDYEYRIIGDAHIVAHGFSMQGKLLSQMDRYAPGYGPMLKQLYDHVVLTRRGFGFRGWISRGADEPQYIHSESVFLPLGPNDDTVDHVLNFSVYTLPHAAHP
jgi:hypothetical protein